MCSRSKLCCFLYRQACSDCDHHQFYGAYGDGAPYKYIDEEVEGIWKAKFDGKTVTGTVLKNRGTFRGVNGTNYSCQKIASSTGKHPYMCPGCFTLGYTKSSPLYRKSYNNTKDGGRKPKKASTLIWGRTSRTLKDPVRQSNSDAGWKEHTARRACLRNAKRYQRSRKKSTLEQKKRRNVECELAAVCPSSRPLHPLLSPPQPVFLTPLFHSPLSPPSSPPSCLPSFPSQPQPPLGTTQVVEVSIQSSRIRTLHTRVPSGIVQTSEGSKPGPG